MKYVCFISWHFLNFLICELIPLSSVLGNMSQMFSRFREAKLKLKLRKNFLFKSEFGFLGQLVSAEGIRTDPKKTEAIQQWPQPKCVKNIRSVPWPM